MKAILIQTCSLADSTRASKVARSLLIGGYYVSFLGWKRKSMDVGKEIWKDGDKINKIQMTLKAPFGFKVFFYYPVWWVFVFLMLMRNEWDIAYAINFESVPPSVIAGKLKRKPVIYDNLDSWEDYIPLPNAIRKILIKIDKIFMRFASSVVLADDMQVEEMDGIPNSRVLAIYDSPEDVTDTAFKYSESNKEFMLFYAGGLSSARALNLDKAFDSIKNISNIKLVIAGYGDLVDEIKRRSQEVPDKIQFIGSISHEEVLHRTAEADLLFVFRSPKVLANKYICGSKLLETMMCGRPILANKGTSTAKKVLEEHCGIVVDANSIDEIKNAIIMLRDNPKICEELGANSRIAYEERYSWAIMEQRLLTLFRELTET